MTQKKRLYLHIGTTKTGSTSIQHHLNNEYDYLLEQGVLYPKSIRMKGAGNQKVSFNHNLFVKAFFGQEEEKSNEHTIQSKLTELINEIAETSAKKIVISSERLCALRKEAQFEDLKEFLAAFDVKVVVYIRRQDKFIESSFNQKVKAAKKIISIDDLIKAQVGFAEKTLGLYAQHFGKENIIIKIFDDEVKGNLVGNFFSLLGIQLTETVEANLKQQKNISLPNEVTDFIDEVNKLTNNQYSEKIAKVFVSLREATNLKSPKTSRLTPQQLKTIYRKSQPINERILKTYFPENTPKQTLFDWDLKSDLDNHKQYDPIVYNKLILQAFIKLLVKSEKNAV